MECVIQESSARLVVKKSIFTGHACPVSSREEALSTLARLKSASFSAKHHVYCYVLGPFGEEKKFSDDGEPAGTGGRVLLSLLEARQLTDSLVEVDRVFGGILLGTGGLSRAYAAAASAAIEASVRAPLVRFSELKASFPLECADRAISLIGRTRIVTKSFTLRADISASLPLSDALSLKDPLSALTGRDGFVEVTETGWRIDADRPFE